MKRIPFLLLCMSAISSCTPEHTSPPAVYSLTGSASSEVGAATFVVSGADNVTSSCEACFVNEVSDGVWRIVVLGKPAGAIAVVASKTRPTSLTVEVAASKTLNYKVLDTSLASLAVVGNN